MPQFNKSSLSLIVLSAVFFIPFLGGVHLFDWDEINFAEIAREMITTGEYMRPKINYSLFWEKPPLFIWMQVLSMKIFGINEFAARFPNAVAGILTIFTIYNIGKTLKGERFGWIWALAYMGSVLPFLYFKSGIIDPWFNFFIFLGIYHFIRYYWAKALNKESPPLKHPYWTLIAGGVFIGLGMLTKGPVALLLSGMTIGIYFLLKRLKFHVRIFDIVVYVLTAIAVIFLWLGIETINHGPWFITEFLVYQWRLFSTPDAGHAGFPGYHFVVLLIGVFPASIFAVRSFFKMPEESSLATKNFTYWMKILFWVVLILFTIVKSKIVHYSSLCYFPMTYLAALVIYHIEDQKIRLNAWLKAGIIGIALLFITATLLFPILGQHIEVLKPLLAKDPFAVANLAADTHWSNWGTLPGFWLVLLIVYFLLKINKAQYQNAFNSLFIGVGIFVMLTLIFNVSNIEAISQRAAIEFYESKANEDCYILPVGFKSYAHLFYAKKRPVANRKHLNRTFLLKNTIEKPIYVVCKITKAPELRQSPNLEELYAKNGFVFFKKKRE